MLNNIYLSNAKVVTRKPFIYFIAIVKPYPLLYVGQTSQRQGVLGRLLQHLDEEGTFRKRVLEAGVVEIEEIEVVTVDLSKYSDFANIYNRKQDALEFLIHCEMKSQGCKTKIPFEVISFVRNNNLVFDFDIQELSKIITYEVVKRLPFSLEKP